MINELLDQFLKTLTTSEAIYVMKSLDKGDSWKEMNLADLYGKMKKHNIQLGALVANGSDYDDIAMKATDVLLYTLMISERARMLESDDKKEV